MNRALVFSCFAIGALAGCGKQPHAGPQQQMPPPPQVAVFTVIEREEAEWTQSVGRLEAVASVEVRPRVDGFIEEVTANEGAIVKPGDPLFTIDKRPFEAQVKRAEAQVADAKARLEIAQKNAARAKELTAAKAISSEEAEQRAAAVAVAEAAAQAADAALRVAQLDLDYTHVEAPFGGRLGRTLLAAGNLAGPGRSPVTTLVSVDPIYVTFDIDERTWMSARALLMQEQAPELKIAFDGETDWPHAAKLAFPDNRIDPATGTMRLRAVMDNHDGALLAGAYARVRLPVAAATPRLLIDERAIGTDQSNKYALVAQAKPDAPDMTIAAYHPLTLGPSIDGGLRIVRSGVQPGDQVIIDLAKVFFPGMPVRPITEEEARAQAGAAGSHGAPAPAGSKQGGGTKKP